MESDSHVNHESKQNLESVVDQLALARRDG